MSSRVHLSYGEILKFMGGHGDSRSVLEGECVLNAGLVVVVGFRAKDDKGITIFALFLQTSGLTKDPLQVTGELLFGDSSVTVKKLSCTCKAGLSEKCKHIGAVLWYLNRNDINELDELSSTDVKCLWSGDKKAAVRCDYAPKKLLNFCHVQKKPSESIFSEEFLDRAVEMLIDASPGSALALHRRGRLRDRSEAGMHDDSSGPSGIGPTSEQEEAI